ncbi:DUF485 domain-containing protein [Helicobacter sp. MIT 11-5569]|uniref:DUF485 domain-containing protein n=1 Tax=Helicobacter sp. MIT 11-5569 TaxID=1548151 RepID=UPI00051FAC87|nr:DUF485 domain-containing protein [Helicobacter sp. MIT 11-5569]TLD83558.1 DUF485 domain-containing protein [Helicobacter sp. MIT 11-5569]
MKKPLDYQQSIQEFKKFVSFRNKVAIWLSVVVLVCYYAFVISIGLFPDVLGYRLGPSSITLGIIVGIFLIALCITATGLYTFFANQYFDRRQEEILQDLEQSGALEDLKNGKNY